MLILFIIILIDLEVKTTGTNEYPPYSLSRRNATTCMAHVQHSQTQYILSYPDTNGLKEESDFEPDVLVCKYQVYSSLGKICPPAAGHSDKTIHKNSSFISTRSSTDFNNSISAIKRVWRNKKIFDLFFKFFDTITNLLLIFL